MNKDDYQNLSRVINKQVKRLISLGYSIPHVTLENDKFVLSTIFSPSLIGLGYYEVHVIGKNPHLILNSYKLYPQSQKVSKKEFSDYVKKYVDLLTAAAVLFNVTVDSKGFKIRGNDYRYERNDQRE